MSADYGKRDPTMPARSAVATPEPVPADVVSDILAEFEENITVGELLQKMCAKEKERIWANHAAEVERLQALVQSQLMVAKAQVS
mmetsp:Transcript_42002/g.96457  ORF Transcript_42002/g.96457 Transcript_42002/m.96457 type:complete len:85 (+) Transcript_42002:132-386(+)